MAWRILAALAAVVLSVGAPAAEPVAEHGALGVSGVSGVSGVLGVWAVDTARLPMPPEARPRSVTIHFTDAGGGRLRMQVEVVDPAGGVLRADGVTPLDGTPTAVPANFEADVSATLLPRPEVLVMQLGKDGHPGSTRIYTVLPGGQAMVETVAAYDDRGQPVLRRNHFTRVR